MANEPDRESLQVRIGHPIDGAELFLNRTRAFEAGRRPWRTWVRPFDTGHRVGAARTGVRGEPEKLKPAMVHRSRRGESSLETS